MGSKATKVSSDTKGEKKKEKGKSVEEEEGGLERVEFNVKEEREGVIRIALISDTNNLHRTLQMPEGDILIHAGDFTNGGTHWEINDFDTWLAGLNYQHKILVPGNHDKVQRRRRPCCETPVLGKNMGKAFR